MEKYSPLQTGAAASDWCTKICTHLFALHENSLFTDITLLGNDGIKLKAHACVLAASSSVLAKQMKHGLGLSIDVPSTVLKSLLKLLYCGTLDAKDPLLPQVIQVAQEFEVVSVQRAAQTSLVSGAAEKSANMLQSPASGSRGRKTDCKTEPGTILETQHLPRRSRRLAKDDSNYEPDTATLVNNIQSKREATIKQQQLMADDSTVKAEVIEESPYNLINIPHHDPMLRVSRALENVPGHPRQACGSTVPIDQAKRLPLKEETVEEPLLAEASGCKATEPSPPVVVTKLDRNSVLGEVQLQPTSCLDGDDDSDSWVDQEQISVLHREENIPVILDLGTLPELSRAQKKGSPDAVSPPQLTSSAHDKGASVVRTTELLHKQEAATVNQPVSTTEGGVSGGKCTVCGVYRGTPLALKKHEQTHGVELQPNLPCPKCPMKFKTRGLLEKHTQTKHVDTACEICGWTKARGSVALWRHKRVAHGILNKSWQCDKCGKSYHRKSALDKHYSKLHLNIKYQCEYCEYSTKDKGILRDHERMVHMGENLCKYQCELCGDQFMRPYLLKEHHQYKHTKPEEWQHTCKHCPKKFANKKKLRGHQMLHKCGARRRVTHCLECNQEFTSRAMMEKHRHIVHLQDTTCTCSECGKQFTHPSNLKRHMLRHVSTRDFKCTTCGADFSAKEDLIKHNHIHFAEKRFECRFCQKRFLRKIFLLQHERTHTKERPLVCDICGRGFRCNGNLTSHKRTQHPAEYRHEQEMSTSRVSKRRTVAEQQVGSEEADNMVACEIVLDDGTLLEMAEVPLKIEIDGQTHVIANEEVISDNMHTCSTDEGGTVTYQILSVSTE